MYDSLLEIALDSSSGDSINYWYMVQDVLIPFITVFALALFFIGWESYRRSEHPKIAAVSLAFLIFFIKGAIMSVGLYTDYMALDISESFVPAFDVLLVLDLAILTLLYLAIFKK
jgi:hypothetical protein